jgi:signal transduction histidine kinase
VAVAQGDPVRARIDPEVRGAAPALVPSVLRIIAESLTNVRRHAREVGRIEVDVLRRAGRLVVSVHDDGAAAAPPGHDTFGIVGMRERTASLGGSLFAGPAPVGGWLVRAELPLEHHR